MTPTPASGSNRIDAIDIARGVALLAMAIYHFTWDLEFFGYAEPGLTAVGGWKLFARAIASSFLFLVGVGLYLGHRKEIRWRPFARRLAMIVAAALAITVVTYFATPDNFIFFGILHQIALASVLGLAFLRLPAVVILAAAAAVIAGSYYLTSPAFDHPIWWWTGLSADRPRSSDYVPLFPWFGAVLAGIGCAKIADGAGVFGRMRGKLYGGWSTPFIFAGRHSLATYLIHQPVLIGLIWTFAQIFPPPTVPEDVKFTQACERGCAAERDPAFCTSYCACMLEEIEGGGLLDQAFSPNPPQEFRDKVPDMAALCTGMTEEAAPEQ